MRERENPGNSNKSKRGIICGALLLLAAGTGGMFAFQMMQEKGAYDEGEAIYAEISDDAVPLSARPGVVDGEQDALLDVDFDALLRRNPDTMAWLSFVNGKVSLPVVQEREDNVDYYLDHALDGTESKYGCLFTDSFTDKDFRNYNAFIYGHNMADGKMFGSLRMVQDDRSLLTDPYFDLYTVGGEHIRYRIISMFVDKADCGQFSIPNIPEEYDSYLERSLALGSTSGVKPFEPEEVEAMDERMPLVTMYVCHSSSKTNRLYVQGVEILREEAPHVK